MSQYPRDEFDDVRESAERQGVHRERILPDRTGPGLIVTICILALLLGAASYVVLPRLGIGNSGPEQATPSAAPTGTVTGAAGSEPEPGPVSAPADSAGQAVTGETARAGERSEPVVILNASGVPGMEAAVSADIAADGWETLETADWTGQPLASSVIFYGSPGQEQSAAELGDLLGIPVLSQSAEFTYITVAAGPDYQ